MYIEFSLPNGAGGQAAQYVNATLTRNLNSWASRYDIAYIKKIHKWTVRVTFDNEKYYDFFALTWHPSAEYLLSYLTDYRLIEPMNRV